MFALSSIIVILVLVVVSGLLSASETALFSISSNRRGWLSAIGCKRCGMVARVLEDSRQLLVTLLVFNVGVNIFTQSAVADIFGGASNLVLSVVVPFLLVVVFGEALPKSMAYLNSDRIALVASPVLFWGMVIISPIRRCLSYIADVLSRALFFSLKGAGSVKSEELKSALYTSKAGGAISSIEAQLIRGYINIKDSHVGATMVPRGEMPFFNVHGTLNGLGECFMRSEESVVLVCDGVLDRIMGLLTCSSFFLSREQIRGPFDLFPLLDEPYYVPESMMCCALLKSKRFYTGRFAVVVDEYGSISGCITPRILFRKISLSGFGANEALYSITEDGVVVADGKLDLVKLEGLLETHFESEHGMATVGGWLTEAFGEIPKAGDSVKMGGCLFRVLSADEVCVHSVYVEKVRDVCE